MLSGNIFSLIYSLCIGCDSKAEKKLSNNINMKEVLCNNRYNMFACSIQNI